MINYFAYGSNMDKGDLDRWCRNEGFPVIELLSVFPAKLTHYKLTFNYSSSRRDGGAANIMISEEDCVYGLLMEIKEEDRNTIREKEGYPSYYGEICVDVEGFDGTIIKDVTTYKVRKRREKPNYQPPTRDYLGLIVRNAEKYGFPVDHIQYLKSLETKG